MPQEPSHASEGGWTSGTKESGLVTVYDRRFTNLRRVVNADSTAARMLPHVSPLPFDVSSEALATLYPDGQPGVGE